MGGRLCYGQVAIGSSSAGWMRIEIERPVLVHQYKVKNDLSKLAEAELTAEHESTLICGDMLCWNVIHVSSFSTTGSAVESIFFSILRIVAGKAHCLRPVKPHNKHKISRRPRSNLLLTIATIHQSFFLRITSTPYLTSLTLHTTFPKITLSS